jgi:hypothetical protein
MDAQRPGWEIERRFERGRGQGGTEESREEEGMSQELKPGDHVRVTSQRQVHGYQPGSTGIVRSGPTTDKSGKTYYGVSMDKDASNDGTLFLADEIEPAE